MVEQGSRAVGRDIKAMGLIGLGHGTSHFFQLVLPPLFPYLIAEFEVDYAELGVLMTVFFVTSGFGQPIAGFLVDRMGARKILFTGLSIYCLGIFIAALAPSIWLLAPAIALAAIGNCVFHPADFTILNASVSADRLGRAYGVHTLGGNLGWAAAPITMTTVAIAFDWRTALFTAVGIGVLVLATLAWNRDVLKEEHQPRELQASAAPRMGLGPLMKAPVLLCFTYFVLLAAALIAVQSFLSPTLAAIHETPWEIAGMALTGFLLGASAGVLVGGFIADSTPRHGLIIAAGLAGAGMMFVLVGEVALNAIILIFVLSLAGFLQGITTPARDLLVRSATPKGATGRVFGFVYAGLDVGSALAPVTVGLILVRGDPRLIFWLVSGMLFLAIFTAVSIGQNALPRPQAAE